MEIDLEDLLGVAPLERYEPEEIHIEDFVDEDSLDIKESVETEKDPEDNAKELEDLCGRLKMWHQNCRDLLVDLRTINYQISEDDTFIEFRDKSYYEPRLYFKVDPQNPKDAKVIHATKQLCKIIGIPYAFFAANRPSLKMNIVRTWQAGLADDVKKAQNVLKIRESKDCTIIRAITPTSKSFIPLHEIVQIIRDSLGVPFKLEGTYGDGKDDLIFNARFLFEKEHDFNGPICLGFSITASELDACPLSIDVLLYNKRSKTSCIAMYGGDSYFKSDYKGLQSNSLKEMLPLMLSRLENETPEILSRLDQKQRRYTNSIFCAESDAMEICTARGLTSKIKKAIYHQVSECIDEILTPWDLATHVGLVAKDFDAITRIKIEKAIGIYLNLFFSEGNAENDVRESE